MIECPRKIKIIFPVFGEKLCLLHGFFFFEITCQLFSKIIQ